MYYMSKEKYLIYFIKNLKIDVKQYLVKKKIQITHFGGNDVD